MMLFNKMRDQEIKKKIERKEEKCYINEKEKRNMEA
jgi:hypothetical protein